MLFNFIYFIKISYNMNTQLNKVLVYTFKNLLLRIVFSINIRLILIACKQWKRQSFCSERHNVAYILKIL